ncbi:hypothetical protein SteCoe_12773 [Stentor coeruleus]|uniref:FHA domain-containing protein n=1 Tax=Stentor coeruleus TaxID=5963 RepID=A0A1R2CA26_9CILI|nr:hypothetical protein SteCoe_12773 [Stentor coeruleus]
MKKTITLKSETWKRDSHGLFDYESKETQKHKLIIQENSYVIRKNDTVELEKSLGSTSTGLAYIISSGSSYKILPLNEPLWKVVRDLKEGSSSKAYILKQNDTLKFGRVKYTVKELRSSPNEDMVNAKEVEVDTEGNSCKICLSEVIEPDNPLVSCCHCAGTMKYIHIQCLRMCVAALMTVKNNEKCITYTWKSMSCSLCGEPFSNALRANGILYHILSVQRPEIPYFIIEASSIHGNNRGMQIVSLKNSESVMLGRGHDSDMRISDISVSRIHARIKFHQGQFLLEDHNSKFGTLVQVNEIELVPDERLALQCGRSLLTFKLKNS